MAEADLQGLRLPNQAAALLLEGFTEVAPDAWAESLETQRALAVISKAQSELTKRTRRMIDFSTADQMAKHANWKPYQAAA